LGLIEFFGEFDFKFDEEVSVLVRAGVIRHSFVTDLPRGVRFEDVRCGNIDEDFTVIEMVNDELETSECVN